MGGEIGEGDKGKGNNWGKRGKVEVWRGRTEGREKKWGSVMAAKDVATSELTSSVSSA